MTEASAPGHPGSSREGTETTMMQRLKILMLAIALAGIPGVAQADLSLCGSKIQTVDNLLQRLGDDRDGETKTNLSFRPFRQINPEVARAQVEAARAAMRQGLQFECDFHVVAALRALGYLL